MGNLLTRQLPSSPKETTSENEVIKDSTKHFGYPGTLEDLHKRCRDVFPPAFDGVKLLVNKSLSKHLQVSHSVHLGGINESGYRFGATYIGSDQTELGERCPVLIGEIDPTGDLNANGVYALSAKIKSKFCVQMLNGKFQIFQMSANYQGDDSSITMILSNPSIMGASGTGVCHYLKQVTPRIALGAELAYQVGKGVPGGHTGTVTFGARWTGNTCIWSTTVSKEGGLLCFYQRASDQLSLGVEFEKSSRLRGSVATLGYIVDLPKAEVTIRGLLNSDGVVGAIVEKKLEPLPVNFAMAASLNHTTGEFSLGCGVVIT